MIGINRGRESMVAPRQQILRMIIRGGYRERRCEEGLGLHRIDGVFGRF